MVGAKLSCAHHIGDSHPRRQQASLISKRKHRHIARSRIDIGPSGMQRYAPDGDWYFEATYFRKMMRVYALAEGHQTQRVARSSARATHEPRSDYFSRRKTAAPVADVSINSQPSWPS